MRALLLLALLAGCAAQVPPPADTTITPPAAWRDIPAGTAAIDAQWWRGFGDPALSALVEKAIAHNPDIGLAAARVREARAAEAASRAVLLPAVDASGGASHARSLNAFGQPSVSTGAQPVVQASYELDLFGRLADQISAARSQYLASVAAADAARLSVSAATATGYLTLLGLDARRQVVVETIASRAEALRIARSRAAAGYTSQLELRQAEAEFEATRLALPQVELAIARQEHALSVLTGTPPAAIPRGRTLAEIAMPPIPDAGVPSELLRRRPDVAQAEQTLAASAASLSVARKQFVPQIRLAASAGSVFSSLLDDPVAIWSLGGSVLAPLFEGGRLQAGVDAAAARRDQAAFAYGKTTLTALREAEDAGAAVRLLADQAAAQQAQRTAVAEALRHAANRYRAGYSSYLEQLDAQRALFQADTAVVQLQTDRLNALVALYQALGGGWQPG